MKNASGALWAGWFLLHAIALWWCANAILGGMELAHITALSPRTVKPEDASAIIASEAGKSLILPLLSAAVTWRLNSVVLREAGVLQVKEKAIRLALACGLVLSAVVIFGSVRGLQTFQNGEFVFQKMAARRQEKLRAQKQNSSVNASLPRPNATAMRP